ncbi:hypothetical protein ACU27_22375 [Klebsiella variicola]|nr:hypothetical protein AC813_22375 [Klebsiella variicola]OBR57733.1 hypothetical protein ACU27_22375 [Klebsiella variicola]
MYVAATAKSIGFADETVVVQGDAVGMTGIQFTSGQHRLYLADKMWKYHIQLKTFFVTKLTGDTSPVSQIVQPIALLHQTCSQARSDIPLQAPCSVAHL